MATVAEIRASKPEALITTATGLAALARRFSTAVDGVQREVEVTMVTWQGESAAAASARSAAEHVAGSRIGTAMVGQVDALNDAGSALGSARKLVVTLADNATAEGCFVLPDGHVRAPNMKLLTMQSAAAEVARVHESRLLPAVRGYNDLDVTHSARIAAATHAVADLIRDPENQPVSERVRRIEDGIEKLPADPKEFHDLWMTLSPSEKDALWQRDQYLGNHDGMPASDRDHYNRMKLDDERTRAVAADARLSQLRVMHPEWGNTQPPPTDPRYGEYLMWRRERDSAVAGSKHLKDLTATNAALAKTDTMLMTLDTQTGRQAHVAIAVGNPDTADHVSITAPGVGTTVGGSLNSMVDEAAAMRDTAMSILDKFQHGDESVATIAWIGADVPQMSSATGVVDVVGDTLAHRGAGDLARFYDGLGVAAENPNQHMTAVGHSYGSVMTGLALQEPGRHPVDDLVLYGSPGVPVDDRPGHAGLADLHMQPGHAFEMTASGDAIAHLSSFGESPGYRSEFTHLSTDATTTPDGVARQSAHGHSDYARPDEQGTLRTSGYNTAAVIGGLPHDPKLETDPLVTGPPASAKAADDLTGLGRPVGQWVDDAFRPFRDFGGWTR